MLYSERTGTDFQHFGLDIPVDDWQRIGDQVQKSMVVYEKDGWRILLQLLPEADGLAMWLNIQRPDLYFIMSESEEPILLAM